MTDSGRTPVAAVVFDYGGVLTTPVRDSIADWLDRDGIDPASFSRTLRAWLSRRAPAGTPIHRLETGELPPAEFEAVFAAELVRHDGSAVWAPGLLQAMFAKMLPNPEMFALVRQVRDCGVQVALLSNSWGNSYPRSDLDTLFRPVLISGEIGMRKPAPEIFYQVVSLLDVEPERTVFIDDGKPNLEGAARVGLRPVLHVSAAATRAALTSLIPELAPSPSQQQEHAA